jgi:hypothetical protein
MIADGYRVTFQGQASLFLDHAAADAYVARMHMSGADVKSLYGPERIAEICRAAMLRAGVPHEFVPLVMAELAPLKAT